MFLRAFKKQKIGNNDDLKHYYPCKAGILESTVNSSAQKFHQSKTNLFCIRLSTKHFFPDHRGLNTRKYKRYYWNYLQQNKHMQKPNPLTVTFASSRSRGAWCSGYAISLFTLLCFRKQFSFICTFSTCSILFLPHNVSLMSDVLIL